MKKLSEFIAKGNNYSFDTSYMPKVAFQDEQPFSVNLLSACSSSVKSLNTETF
jgi:hypothetical protein